MEDKRNKNKSKYNELNHLIKNYFKSEVNDEQNLEKLVGNISKIKYRFKLPSNQKNQNSFNSPKTNNINSPSFGCRKPKSVDNINVKKFLNINYNNKIINSCYKRPRHYIYNKSVDNIKKKINDRYYTENYNYDNNVYNNKYQNISNNYNSKYKSPQKRDNEYYNDINKNQFSNNTNYSNINSNEMLRKKESSDIERVNSFENIFTKIPTNISRIKKNNNNDYSDDSLNDSLLNNNINNINNYYKTNSQNKQYMNNNFLGYNNTFYNDKNFKNLSIEIPKQNEITKEKYNKERIHKRIYCKTPIQRKTNNNKKNIRKKTDDYNTMTSKNNMKNNLINISLNTDRKRKEEYYSYDTYGI